MTPASYEPFLAAWGKAVEWERPETAANAYGQIEDTDAQPITVPDGRVVLTLDGAEGREVMGRVFNVLVGSIGVGLEDAAVIRIGDRFTLNGIRWRITAGPEPSMTVAAVHYECETEPADV